MPIWLRRQLKRAYSQKDLYQIRILNQCWFYYRKNDTRVKELRRS